MESENKEVSEQKELSSRDQLRARLNPAIFILKGLVEKKNGGAR